MTLAQPGNLGPGPARPGTDPAAMLRLPGDHAATGRPLPEALAGDGPAAITLAIAQALPPLAARLAAGRLHGDPEAVVGTNDSGDRQKAVSYTHLTLPTSDLV